MKLNTLSNTLSFLLIASVFVGCSHIIGVNSVVRLDKLVQEESCRLRSDSDSATVVHFVFDKTIDGYSVGGCLLLEYPQQERAYAKILFVKDREWFCLEDSAFTTISFLQIPYEEGFKGWDENQQYVFKYLEPECDTIYYSQETPFGYYSSFQFMDIDFDGEDELIANDYSRKQGGNQYYAYKIHNHQVSLLTKAPFNNLCNLTKINRKEQTIENFVWSGASTSLSLTYKRDNSKDRLNDAQPDTSKVMHFQEYLTEEISNGFTLYKAVYEAELASGTCRYCYPKTCN